MLRKVVGLVGGLGGLALGLYLNYIYNLFITEPGNIWSYMALLGISLAAGTMVGLLLYFVVPLLIDLSRKTLAWVDHKFYNIPTQDIVLGVFALLIALFIGLFLGIPLSRIPVVGVYLSLAFSLLLAFWGVKLALTRKKDFAFLSPFAGRLAPSQHMDSSLENNQIYKILDTSVIIDGRIVDICKTGFLEGVIVVPEFVLEELRHIADSPDLLKRNRGRRGLDILNKIQKEMHIPVEIYEGDFEEISEVDSKLVKLAKLLNGKIITNDFNLNKVCELQGVSVLNMNELANAVKPVVLPGEEMSAHIIKDGKEAGQGIAYLEDGTMIVVEDGKKHIGETLDVLVTSVLQTAAGRMIFAKPKNASERMTGVK